MRPEITWYIPPMIVATALVGGVLFVGIKGLKQWWNTLPKPKDPTMTEEDAKDFQVLKKSMGEHD